MNLFEQLRELNALDVQDGGSRLHLSNNIINAVLVQGKGVEVTVGLAQESYAPLANGTHSALLILIPNDIQERIPEDQEQ